MKPDLKGVKHHNKAPVQSFSMGGEVRDAIKAYSTMRQLQQGQSRADYYDARAKALKANTFDPEAAGKAYDEEKGNS
jgi:uncharacterized protein involved in type VI secretion and phage assembly